VIAVRTNNVLESYHSCMKRRVKVSYPNLFTFLGHLQRATVDYMSDVARVTNGLHIRRPKKKTYLLNESRIKLCIERFDSENYTRMQFLIAVSHNVGAHTKSLHSNINDSEDDELDQLDITQASTPQVNTVPAAAQINDCCDVFQVASRSPLALVPCGHSRFCSLCIQTLQGMGSGCPLCRTRIDMVIQVYI
jgi:hypothetical protein